MKNILIVTALVASLVIFSACSQNGPNGSGGDLTGKLWVLNQLNGNPTLPNTTLTAEFTAAGTVSGAAGCNRYSGSYTVDGGSISISPQLAQTMMACDEAVMDQETAYTSALVDAQAYSVEGNQLTLIGKNNVTLAVFSAQSQDLAGSSWDVLSYNNGNQAVVSVLPGTNLTAEFGADGALSGFAGCNNYNGSYQVNGDKITIGPLVTTRMACAEPAGVMEQEAQYLAALESAATFKVEGQRLEMRTQDGAMAANFALK